MASSGTTDSTRRTRRGGEVSRGPFALIQDALDRPSSSFYMVLVPALLLILLGAVMVLSASSVYAQATMDNPWYIAERHLFFLVVGSLLAWFLATRSEQMLRVLSHVAFYGSIVMLCLVFVPGLGTDQGKGNHAWLALGPISLQPSEFAKLGLVMWSAAVIAAKGSDISKLKELSTVLLGFAGVIALVILEKDLGTVLVLGAICFGVLLVLGVPWKILSMLIGLAATVVAILVVTSPNRMKRIYIFLGKAAPDPDASTQPLSAIYALATGGWWGVGIGWSRQKWGNLNDGAQNDFVFAVLGEEMGLFGTVSVILLFGVLIWAGIRIAQRSDSTFCRMLCAGITIWLMFQSMVNMAVALGLAPVVGVPLPFISAGGSALMANVMSLGLLLACARHEPQARRARARRRGEPQPRVTTVVDTGR